MNCLQRAEGSCRFDQLTSDGSDVLEVPIVVQDRQLRAFGYCRQY